MSTCHSSKKTYFSIKDPQVILTGLCGIFFVLGYFGIHPVIPYLSALFGSYFGTKAAITAVKKRQLDVNFLMVLAAIGAILVNRAMDAAALLFLFSLSATLESLAMARTQAAIEGLIKLRPNTAIRVKNNVEEEILTENLELDDIIKVLPYQQIPADGIIVQGEGSVDESAMTGESTPKDKIIDDHVFAGTQNLDRLLLVKVTTLANETTLEKIVRLVEEAQEQKASGEKISVWFGQKYTFFVLGCFIVALIVRSLFISPDFNDALYRSLTLLVALSPCALVISIPASTLSALAYCARQGILVRGGLYVEAAGKADTIALDKTGTITEGKLSVQEICIGSVEEGLPHNDETDIRIVGGTTAECTEEICLSSAHIDEELPPEFLEVLRIAAAAERDSTHPIAEAIVKAAIQKQLEIPTSLEHTNFTGLGVTAKIENHTIKIGQTKFFEKNGDQLPHTFKKQIESMQEKGLTAVIMKYNGTWVSFGVRDTVRPGAKKFIKDLRNLGFGKIVMLTGDHPKTAHTVGKELDIDEIHHSLMPVDKEKLVSKWSNEGKAVMMIGDGVNDAPSLAKSSIGVAMGGLGSDIALNAADVVLMQEMRIIRLELI